MNTKKVKVKTAVNNFSSDIHLSLIHILHHIYYIRCTGLYYLFVYLKSFKELSFMSVSYTHLFRSLRYAFGGDHPSQTTHQSMSPFHGLESKQDVYKRQAEHSPIFSKMQIYTYVICVMYMLRLSIKLMTIICNFFHSYFYSD